MQNRYVGDVGDFAKYGLLRCLVGRSGERGIRLGVLWCLFPNEAHNNDGRHISYLRKPEFTALDDPLLAVLREVVASGNRCISAISNNGLFPEDTVFCDTTMVDTADARLSGSERAQYRANWLDGCFAATADCELVFFDPDNGLEVKSVPKNLPNAGKYIYWDELEPFWNRGQALLVYHHVNRLMPVARQVRSLREEFRARLKGARVMPLLFRRGSCRVFWLIYSSSSLGAVLEVRAREFLAAGWSRHFQTVE